MLQDRGKMFHKIFIEAGSQHLSVIQDGSRSLCQEERLHDAVIQECANKMALLRKM